MTSSQTISTIISSNAFRKRWIQWALAVSLVLHFGAALIIIIASDFSTGDKNLSSFVIQDVALTPSISAPAKTVSSLPTPPPVMTSPTQTQTPAIETEKSLEETAPEQNTSDSSKTNMGLMSTPLGLGMTHGYFSSLADGRTLRDDIRGYYFELVEKINRGWWDKAGLLKEPLRRDGVFEVLVRQDGAILSVRNIQSTGSREADHLVMEVIMNTSPLRPLPASYDLGTFRAPIRIKAPSFLFRIRD